MNPQLVHPERHLNELKTIAAYHVVSQSRRWFGCWSIVSGIGMVLVSQWFVPETHNLVFSSALCGMIVLGILLAYHPYQYLGALLALIIGGIIIWNVRMLSHHLSTTHDSSSGYSVFLTITTLGLVWMVIPFGRTAFKYRNHDPSIPNPVLYAWLKYAITALNRRHARHDETVMRVRLYEGNGHQDWYGRFYPGWLLLTSWNEIQILTRDQFKITQDRSTPWNRFRALVGKEITVDGHRYLGSINEAAYARYCQWKEQSPTHE